MKRALGIVGILALANIPMEITLIAMGVQPNMLYRYLLASVYFAIATACGALYCGWEKPDNGHAKEKVSA